MEMGPEQRREACQNLIVGFRKSVNPADLAIQKRRRGKYCSQADMAYEIGVSIQKYRDLETGARPPSDEILLKFARVCRLNTAQEEALWIATRQHSMPPKYAPMAGMRVPEEYRELVHDNVKDMAYIIDAAGNVLAYNELWATLFNGHPPRNITRWMALSDEARGSKTVPHPVLTNWRERWAESVLRRLAMTYNALGDQIASLSQLVRDVQDDELAGPIFANVHEPRALIEPGQSTLRPQISPDGDQRPLRHPQWGPGFVRMLWMGPQGSPLSALVVVKFSKTYRAGRRLLNAEDLR